ncbi:MAG: cupin domain-containing protein [Candidatus Bathyarchaeota archaeon]|nr:cupin domain-containing protein [Candidatus Bathyarchaeota archaeon]
MLKKEFPQIIRDLPEANIEFEGVRGWIAQGENHQIVFFEMEPLGEVSEHSHESPQWGIVVEGKLELTINNVTKVYEGGDEYLIPARVIHSARFKTQVRVIDFFSEKARYKPQPSQ